MKHSSTWLAHPGEIPPSNLQELPTALFCITQPIYFNVWNTITLWSGCSSSVASSNQSPLPGLQTELENLMRQGHTRLIIYQATITRCSLVLDVITLLWASLREALPPIATGYKGYGLFARLDLTPLAPPSACSNTYALSIV